MFEVYDFPYDRQTIDMDLFEFVWKNEKGTDCFHEAMKIVHFTSKTRSMLPEWDCWPAVIEARNEKQLASGPSFATRFSVKLRLQRKEQYYIFHIFLIAYLITCASVFPLALKPGTQLIGDRLSLSVSGLLTLVGFKSGVADSLPSVPYRTFASTFLQMQIFTVVGTAMESIASYRLVCKRHLDLDAVDHLEDGLLCCLLVGWTLYFIYAAFCMEHTSWEKVMASQSKVAEKKEKKRGSLDPHNISKNRLSTQSHDSHDVTPAQRVGASTVVRTDVALTRRSVQEARNGCREERPAEEAGRDLIAL
jgi:hypothetical protein